ncbi:MAG: dihydroorotate dehydrogenase electron transfer subunit [Candidatus Omnitrophota bacterium]|nr:MAG: dihydroorotate dehydrogenase electron transfer subunit [Candidatus Omnitrophota bacterium]
MKQFKAKIISNKKIAPGHYILSFKAPKTAKNTKPGQFFNIRVSQTYEPFLRRPFSAHKIARNKIEILYKVVGKATEILSMKKKGDILDVLGPLGNGFDLETGVSSVFLVAGGHGVAPLYALAEQIIRGKSRALIFIGGKTKKHIVSDKELKELGAKVYISTEDGSKGYKGLITDLVIRHCKAASRLAMTTIYACGPKPMLKEVAKLARRYKMPCRVSLEEYMACGIGTCLGCAVKTRTGFKLVCKDGPVFDSREIIWT